MSADAILFAGPSIAGFRQSLPADLNIQPPCRQGDIYLATLENPAVIGIVDGYFEGQPSVWHKEILWALSRGIHVIGASSMGALRASELDDFGMVGLGKIYEWYRDGYIEDDEEVALIHAPEELNFQPLNLATVNVRATCERGLELGVMTVDVGNTIVELAKGIFYKQRNWGRLTVRAAQEETAKDLATALAWFAENEVDQKELDAKELCDFIVENDFGTAFEPCFEFEETEFWFQNTRSWGKQNTAPENMSDGEGYRLFT